MLERHDLHAERTKERTPFDAFKKLMEERRAIRVFDGTPVPESVIQEVLETSLLTANSSNLQPYEFYWIRSPELRVEINHGFIFQSAARTASELIVAVARTETWDENRQKVHALLKAYGKQVTPQNLNYYAVTCKNVYNQGRFGFRGFIKRVINHFLGRKRAIVRAPSSHAEMKVWAVKSTAMVCQSLVMGFQAAGYETCPLEGFDSTRVKKSLGLAKDAVVVMGIAVGRRSYNGVVSPRVRLPSSNFIKEV